MVRLPADYRPGKPYVFDGADLFANFTPQPLPTPEHDANGYAALAVWDLVENGGNGDGAISADDKAVQLGVSGGGIVLWIDSNYDGIAQPEEIRTFAQMGLASINVVDYHPAHWVDKYGNKFRYASPVTMASGIRAPSFDVFFVLGAAEKSPSK